MFFKRWSFWAVLLLGLVPLVWYRDGLPIAGGDNYYLLNPRPLFFDFLHTWIGRLNLGVPNLQTSLLFPYTFFWYLFGLFGLSPVAIERLWSITLFLLPGVSIYLLFSYLRKSSGHRLRTEEQLASLAVAAWYMFNAWVMVDVLAPVSRLIAGLTPLFLLFWIKGLEAERFSLRYPLLIGITSIFLSSTYAQPVAGVAIPLAGGLYLVFFLGRTRRFSHALRNILSIFFFFLVFNLWWLLPYFISMQGLYSSFESAARSHDFLYATPLFEAFRFMGFWAFRMQFNATTPHVPYAPLFYEPLFILLTYALAILSLTAAVFRPRHKYVVFFTLLGLLGVFLSKGANPPFGGVYRFLYDHLPGFAAFREPYARFTGIQVFSFSLLLGYSLEFLAGRLRGRLGSPHRGFMNFALGYWPAGVVGIILLLSFPILTGQVIQDVTWHGLTYESLHVAVPDYWRQLSSRIGRSDASRTRTLLLPRTPYGHCYRWQSGTCTGGPVASLFLSHHLLFYPETAIYQGDDLLQNLYQHFDLRTDYRLDPLFDFLGINYVLAQNDILWERSPFEIKDPQSVARILSAQDGLTFKEALGGLDLYEYSKGGFRPEVFPAGRRFYVEGDGGTLPDKILLNGGFMVGDVYRFSRPETAQTALPLVPSFVDFKGEAGTTVGKKFTLKAGTPARYQLLIKEVGTKFLLPGRLRYRLDGQVIPSAEKSVVGSSWYSLGTYALNGGEHVLEIETPPSGSLLSGEGFFNGKLAPAADGPETWLLPDQPGTPVSFIPLTKVLSGSSYKLSFWYKNLKGLVPRYGISENNCAVPIGKKNFDGRLLVQAGCQTVSWSSDLAESLDGRYVETVIRLRSGTQSAFVFFEFNQPEAILAVSSIKMEHLFDAALTAKTEEEKDLAPREGAPQISYRQINPAKYHVFVQGQGKSSDFEIVLNESFNGNWKIYPLPRGGLRTDWPLRTFFLKEVPESRHFVANGFANGWEIGEEGELIIEYRPQRYYILGLTVLLGGLALSFFCLAVRIKYGRQQG